MSDIENIYEERREFRRRRRKRNQILSYITVVIFILLLAMGIVFGVQYLSKVAEDKQQVQESQQALVDEILKTEESMEVPSTEEPVEEVVIELTPEQKLDEIVNAGIEVMSLEDKVAGLFIVTPESITGVSKAVKAGDGTRDALAKYAVGGLIYFKQNIVDEVQFRELVDNTKLYSKYPLFIAVDEEGGKVSRLAQAGLGTKVSSAKEIAETGDVTKAYEAGETIGKYLADFGINLDFAPVADLSNVQNSIMSERSYADKAVNAIPYVNAMLSGLQDQKITGCVKHFPGIGSSAADTHKGIAKSERTLDEFKAEEFSVFAQAIENGADMIMVGHMAAPALTMEDNLPCSLSENVVTNYLRSELGYKGVIITDALNMAAVSQYYASDEAAIMALKAGCDMLLMPEDFEKAYEGVLEAVRSGTISEERINDALRRVYRIKYADRVESIEE